MNYPEFETEFEAQFQKHTASYPHAVEYHRARFKRKSIRHGNGEVLIQIAR